MARPTAIIVSDPRLGHILPDAERALKERGHQIVRMSCDEFCAARSPAHQEAIAVLVGVNFRFTGDLMQQMPKLKAIISGVVGTDTIEWQHATARGISVAHSPAPETAESLAEATILLMLALLYRLNVNEESLRQSAPRPERPIGQMLKGRTIGLVGVGPVARAVAKRLQAWDVSVLGYSHARDRGDAGTLVFVELEHLLRTSDIVSVHAALNPRTANLLTAERLGLMKRGAFFINTARGGIVDEQALFALVRAGHITNVALDVFRTEPLPAGSPLRTLEHAVLTPHMIGHTQESLRAMTRMAVENVEQVLRGALPAYLARGPVVASP
jgi:phosphoglycerate dehydrogenase-like enzyme